MSYITSSQPRAKQTAQMTIVRIESKTIRVVADCVLVTDNPKKLKNAIETMFPITATIINGLFPIWYRPSIASKYWLTEKVGKYTVLKSKRSWLNVYGPECRPDWSDQYYEYKRSWMKVQGFIENIQPLLENIQSKQWTLNQESSFRTVHFQLGRVLFGRVSIQTFQSTRPIESRFHSIGTKCRW